MICTRFIASIASITGILVLSSVMAFGQPATSEAEHESHHPAPASQGMGMGMMGGPEMMGPGVMGGPGGMMNMPMMQMMNDPKTRGQMMEIQGRMMKEMGELMEKRGKELEQSK